MLRTQKKRSGLDQLSRANHSHDQRVFSFAMMPEPNGTPYEKIEYARLVPFREENFSTRQLDGFPGFGDHASENLDRTDV